MKKETLKVQIIYDKIADKTRTLVWDSSTLQEHKIIDGLLHDTQANKETVLKTYRGNIGNESKIIK